MFIMFIFTWRVKRFIVVLLRDYTMLLSCFYSPHRSNAPAFVRDLEKCEERIKRDFAVLEFRNVIVAKNIQFSSPVL